MKLLRNLTTISRHVYTCLFVPTSSQSISFLSPTVNHARAMHLTPLRPVLDKDVEKRASNVGTLKTTTDESPSEEMEIKLEGLMTSGIPYPSIETHSMVIDGTRYDELPVIHVFASRNNTIMTLADYKGNPLTSSSGGAEGFRNARKGTNLAGQAVGLTVGQRALSKGMKYVRVSARDFGPGRLPSIKGLQMAGVVIVSITDATKLPFNINRPRKQRRL